MRDKMLNLTDQQALKILEYPIDSFPYDVRNEALAIASALQQRNQYKVENERNN